MKFLTALFVLILVFNSYPQADLTIDLFLYDSGNPPFGGSIEITFGLDSTATDGIDPHLGESEVPPDACPVFWFPYFCAKFLLPPFVPGFSDTRLDFRFGEIPYTGQKTHMIFFVTNDSIITMEYNLPLGVTLNLSDALGGIFIATLIDSGQVIIPDDLTTGYSMIWMIVDYDNVVPVELTSFAGEQFDNLIYLNWATSSEYNNSGFEILRFTQNDNEWNSIGFVPGFGTTTEPKSYSFTDENVTTGSYKYRLKQIDFDGSFTYSNEIEVEVDFTPKEFVLYQNYPNPFNPSTKIKYSIPKVETHRDASLQMVTLKVYDVLGNEVSTLVNEEKQPGVYEVEFDALNLSSGIYFYQLKARDFISIKKMVLLR